MQCTRQRTRSYLAPVLGIFLLMGLFATAGKAAALSNMNRIINADVTPISPACPVLVATFYPTQDNTLFEAELDQNMMSNGAGEYIFTGNTSGIGVRRALISFDIASRIFHNSTIISTTLDLHMSRTIIGDQTVSLHKVLADWGEGSSDAEAEEGFGAPATIGDATWQHTFYSSTMWTDPGGDYAPTASVTQTIGFVGTYTWGTTLSMVADVQSWLLEPDSNFGWIIIGNESVIRTAKRFDSRENRSEDNRPTLTVAFSPATCTYIPMVVN